jgi:membrane-bound serine protease (ClpP class)
VAHKRFDPESGIISMPLLIVAPVLALLLFYFLPLQAALPIYIAILIASVFCYVIMVRTRRIKAGAGRETMIGQEGVAREDIAPEGQIEINGEIWMARARGETIDAGNRVKVLEVDGLVLLVEPADGAGKSSGPPDA